MRRTIGLMLFVAAVLALTDARAQSIVNRAFVLPEVGIASAAGDLAEPVRRGGLDAGSGPSVGVGIAKVFKEGIGTGLRWRYIRLPVRNLESGSVHVSGHVLDFSLYLPLKTKGRALPFVTGSLLMGKPKISGETDDFLYFFSPTTVSGKVSIEWTLGMLVGGGVMTPMGNRFGLYFAGEYGYLATDGSKAEITIDSGSIYAPKKVKIPFNSDWYAVKMGLMIFVGS